MPSQRKFYRSVVTLEILSETPIADRLGEMRLEDIAYEITDGDWSGDWNSEHDELDGPAMAKALQAQGSDPGFFRLTEDGEDDDENAD